MSDSRTSHTELSRDRREDLLTLWDVIGGIAGGASVMALPFLVTVPGLIALLGLCVAVLLPLVAVGLAFGLVSAPFVGIWWLIRRLDRSRRRQADGCSRAMNSSAALRPLR